MLLAFVSGCKTNQEVTIFLISSMTSVGWFNKGDISPNKLLFFGAQVSRVTSVYNALFWPIRTLWGMSEIIGPEPNTSMQTLNITSEYLVQKMANGKRQEKCIKKL